MHHLSEDRAFQETLQGLLGHPPGQLRLEPVAGGCIHQASRLRTGSASYFLKCNDAPREEQFAAEADGLRALAAAGFVRVPEVLATGVQGGTAWLLTEWLDLFPLGDRAAARLGAALAAQHDAVREQCGWPRDNFIGATPQHNRMSGDWLWFWREQRLAPQLQWAVSSGYLPATAERAAGAILRDLDAFFPDGAPRPALLHGDLWGGNAAQDGAGNPVLFDPAVYCGDPETDLAMMDLFGGFPRAFWGAYHEIRPRAAGFDRRRDLYQLYHVLNHVNLFGGGYVAQAEGLIRKLADLEPGG